MGNLSETFLDGIRASFEHVRILQTLLLVLEICELDDDIAWGVSSHSDSRGRLDVFFGEFDL